ncbi:MAG: response regulator [Myxococcales bacterium]|nr:response regulator [Myxococcales bacterium]
MTGQRNTSPEVAEAFHRLRTEVAQLFRRYEQTLLKLAKCDWLAYPDPATALQQITETAAETLSIARVGIWLYENDRQQIRCVDLYESDVARHSSGMVLLAADFPQYFAALEANRTIVAHKARSDPRTAEFTTSYLVPQGITSMLDATIRLGGETIGVVCHEHVGPERRWSVDEQVFAGSMADVASLAMDNWKRKQAEDERRALERKLQDAQRLESLGMLAGGIAHDFNNLLTAIGGNLSLAQQTLSPSSPAWPYLQHIHVASTLAADLTRHLLAYAGRGESSIERLDVNTVVSEITKLLRVSVPSGVTIGYDLAPETLIVEADPGQLHQVMMNLIVNAAEALGESEGSISISTKLLDADARYLIERFRVPELAEGHYVQVDVVDTGSGIDAETRDKIFDPFFSTKFRGRGLGLSVVYGIVRSHGGAIRVESEPGRGTHFTVIVPAVEGAEITQRHEAPLTLPWRGGGLVLVIDDEAVVREVAEEMLMRLGFRVLSRADGEAGVEAYRAHHRDVVGVLLDLTMPHWSGAKTLAQLRLAGCEAPVLLMSGYTERDVLSDIVDPYLADFLAKPFSFNELSQKLRELVVRKGEGSARTAGTDAGVRPLIKSSG